MKDQDPELESRQIGRHKFVFPKENDKGERSSPTIMASPVAVDISQDLPREFTNYMRALFGILDERGTGYVRLSDIEAYWEVKQGQAGSPSGIIESLRKVTPKNGLLDFDRLCTGFKLAIRTQRGGATKIVSPNRSQSMPQLAEPKDKDWASDSSEDSFRIRDGSERSELVEKWRRWRSDGLTDNGSASPAGTSSPSGMGVRQNSATKVYFIGKEDQEMPTGRSTDKDYEGLRGGSSDGGQAHDRERRLRQIEEEHNILRNGMEVIEKARKWYFKRITAVQEEKLHLQQPEAKLSLEQFQYEMLLHKTRRAELNLDANAFAQYKSNIQQLNQHLGRIIESPLKQQINATQDASNVRLKEELEVLRQEIKRKTEQIAQLEREKSVLIRDLFNAKATQHEPPRQPVVKAISSYKPSVKTTSSLKVTLPANR